MNTERLKELLEKAAPFLPYVEIVDVPASDLPVRVIKRITGVALGYYPDRIAALEDLLKKDLASIAVRPKRRLRRR